jgi:hypothetical protein
MVGALIRKSTRVKPEFIMGRDLCFIWVLRLSSFIVGSSICHSGCLIHKSISFDGQIRSISMISPRVGACLTFSELLVRVFLAMGNSKRLSAFFHVVLTAIWFVVIYGIAVASVVNYQTFWASSWIAKAPDWLLLTSSLVFAVIIFIVSPIVVFREIRGSLSKLTGGTD